ncbi:transcriptional repressor TCF25-domain-containing protein [Irpex rosettiformis]|uniref:Transcriptional repressor TCF25-domain-containing protein n=1 Tax=Irpex rosettiformis TaxID=378272 RepID=A0ACB8UF45_9APHY|nr:transcriptional repressor TCF25-domain-containing protein [Irpex rosettiformis]
MAPRLNKRQQRELEELESLQASPAAEPEVEEESEEEVLVKKKKVATGSAFAALMASDDDDESDEEQASATKSKSKKASTRVKKKKKKSAASSITTSVSTATPVVETSTPQTPESGTPSGLSKKEWKALKKQKAKAAKDGGDDLDKALAELALKHPELKQSLPTTTASTTSSAFFSLLAVSLQHLDSEAEMRRFFGSKVISASKASSSSSSSAAAAARRQHQNVKSNLTRPQGTWWPASYRQGLSNRPLTEEEVEGLYRRHGQVEVAGERYWTAEYSKKYRGLTKTFIQLVMSGDPNGLFGLLRHFPYQADTLLQLSEVYFHREEHSTAADFIDRALFTYERAFLGSFVFTSGTNRLDFDHVENRPFFLAVHRQVADLQRRGCVRTSFEFARLLYGLDPATDPHGALLHLDYLAIKAGMQQWVLDMWDAQSKFKGDEWKGRPHVRALPGWAYARALAIYIKEGSNDHTKSTQALREAIRSFPEVVPLLADKTEVTLPGDVRGQSVFRIHPDASGLSRKSDAILHLLSHLYAQRSFSLWKPKERAKWFSDTVVSVASTLPSKPVEEASRSSPSPTLFHKLYTDSPSLAYSIYRHVMVLESMSRTGRLFGFLPSHVTSARQLACDPLPPLTRVSEYNDEFFQGAEDPFAIRVSSRRDNQRLLERMIPDPIFRQQLQDFFTANPQFAQRFPGGIIEFAHIAAQMPEDALEDLMVAVVNGDADGAPDVQGRMPGQMPGEDFLGDVFDVPAGVQDEEPGEDAHVEGVDSEGDEDEEDEDEEEVAPLPVRLLRNVMNRFWGTPTAEGSSDGEQLRDDAGVD